jgi:ABC-type uncharacterized transport system auxiliary subunit
MKRFNKRFLLITMLCCSIMLSGCNTLSSHTSKSDTDSGKTSDQNEIDNAAKTTVSIKPTDAAIAPVAKSDLTIYTANAKEELQAVTVSIPKSTDITPKLIVNEVVKAFKDESLTIGARKVLEKGDTVFISFSSRSLPANGKCSKEMEVTILNAICQSLLENLPKYKHVIFREDGKAYQGGHISLGINEPYI